MVRFKTFSFSFFQHLNSILLLFLWFHLRAIQIIMDFLDAYTWTQQRSNNNNNKHQNRKKKPPPWTAKVLIYRNDDSNGKTIRKKESHVQLNAEHTEVNSSASEKNFNFLKATKGGRVKIIILPLFCSASLCICLPLFWMPTEFISFA